MSQNSSSTSSASSRLKAKKKPNKRVTPRAASFARIAQEHHSYARSHQFIASNKAITDKDRAMHRAVALMHRNSAGINSAEAKRLRAMR